MQQGDGLAPLQERVMTNKEAFSKRGQPSILAENTGSPRPSTNGFRHVLTNTKVAGNYFKVRGYSPILEVFIDKPWQPWQTDWKPPKMPNQILDVYRGTPGALIVR